MSLLYEAWMSQTAGTEPWPEDAALYRPLEEQILLGENADSLSVQAYLRMCGLNTQEVTKSNAEFMAPSGKLPVLVCGNFVISEPIPIINFIKHKAVCLSEEFSEKDKLDLEAYIELVNDVLVPAELFVSWGHEETLKKITYARYGSPYPWPLNHFLCWKKRRSALAFLEGIGWGKSQCSLATVEVEVKRCCHALAQKLGDKQYFFGETPSELDALVFGHLYTLVTTKLPDNRLAETVKSFNNLMHFCKNIDRKYFGEDFYHTSGL